MASEALEQMLGDVRGFEQSIDTYAAGTIALYTGRPMHTPNGFGMPGMMGPGPICDRRDDFERPIGSMGSGFQPEGRDNISKEYDLGEMTGDSSLSGYSLTERYDLSGHDNASPHLNQDIINNRTDSILINSGTSRKNEDGYKGLGRSHRIDLY